MRQATPTDHPRTRQPAVAGQFYPDGAAELASVVRHFLDEAQPPVSCGSGGFARQPPKAIIAPHAGYRYSGPVAATAYKCLTSARGLVERVVLFGPAHRVRFHGIAASSAEAFSTPLGDVPVDRDAITALLELPFVHVLDEAHAPEHCLEVHLPFLLEVLNPAPDAGCGFAVVPLLFGQMGADEAAEAIRRLWGGPETLFVISSDLSHYHDHATAESLDRTTADAIVANEPRRVGPAEACGHLAVQGLMRVCSEHGLSARAIDVRNSGDTAGPADQVVGYGAFIYTRQTGSESPRCGAATIEPAAELQLSSEHRKTLLDVCRSSIQYGLAHHQPVPVDPLEFDAPLCASRAVFVTLKLENRLRGCIGTLEPVNTLIEDTARNAYAAAFNDPRFGPLTELELGWVTIHVSILSPPQPMSFVDEADLIRQIRPCVDGLILEAEGKRGTFLPAVWESVPDARQFLEQLKIKAGLPPDYWSAGVKVSRYTSESAGGVIGLPEGEGVEGVAPTSDL